MTTCLKNRKPLLRKINLIKQHISEQFTIIYTLTVRSMFYPPKGDTQYLTRGPFVFTYVLFGVSKSLEHFKNLQGFSIFFLLQNVLSPEGRYVVSHSGPIDTLSIYCLSERLEHFKNLMGLSRFFSFKMFYLTGGRVDGWTG